MVSPDTFEVLKCHVFEKSKSTLFFLLVVMISGLDYF